MDQNRGESKYERLRKIGIGSYGVVFKCVNRLTGQVVAIKRYSENDSDPIIRKIAMREVRMLRQLKHPNLIYLIEVFRRKRRLHLVFDYCELTVLDVIENYRSFCPLNLIRKIVWQIVNGINYCHSHNCIHRDIKPENILINQSGVVKLCDFGFARTINKSTRRLELHSGHHFMSQISRDAHDLDRNKDNSASVQLTRNQELLDSDRQALTEYVATRWYRAPELLIGEIYYDIKIDIWAIGCVTAELMRGEPIWPGKTDFDQLCIITRSLGQLTESQVKTLCTQGIYDPMSIDQFLDSKSSPGESLEKKLPTHAGESGIEFVKACLQVDPSKRPTSEELLQHSFIYSARMSQFMQEAGSTGGTNGLATERGSVSQNTVQDSTRGQLNGRQTQRSNSQSLALITAIETPATQHRTSIVQPSSKRLVIATEHRPQKIPILQRTEEDSSENKYKRKQPPLKSNTLSKTTKPSPRVDRKSLVPIAVDNTNESSLIRKTHPTTKSAIYDQQVSSKITFRKDWQPKVVRKFSYTSAAYSSSDGQRVVDQKQPVGDTKLDQKSIHRSNNSVVTHPKINQAINRSNNSTSRPKLNIDSSASSTLSDTTSFLPSLFKADDPRKAKYTNQKRIIS